MRVTIDVQNRAEADAVKVAMEDDEIRAFVIGAGALLQLSDQGRRRVIAFLRDRELLRPPRPDAMRLLFDEANPRPLHTSGE